MASSIVNFVKLSNYEGLNTFSSYLKTTSKFFYCEFSKVYVSRIYCPNYDLKLWIIFEFGNLLHRFIYHATFLHMKACKDSGLCRIFDFRGSRIISQYGTFQFFMVVYVAK